MNVIVTFCPLWAIVETLQSNMAAYTKRDAPSHKNQHWRCEVFVVLVARLRYCNFCLDHMTHTHKHNLFIIRI